MSDKPSQKSASESASQNRSGKRIVFARTFTLLAVLVAVLASLAFDSGIGTPSSFGIGKFFLLCPLGGLEAMIASGSFIPISFISLGVLVLISLFFGRVWCAWGCPVPPLRRFFRREPRVQLKHTDSGECLQSCDAIKQTRSLVGSLRHIGCDTRTWVLLVVFVITLAAGFPIFCLICPVGLTFGTVSSLWHFFVDKQTTAGLLLFPLALVIEVLAYRKWCLNLCPIGGLLSLFGQFATLFRPRINEGTCLKKSSGTDCSVCRTACPEHIDLHASDAPYQLGECTRCGNCVKQCPTASIELKLMPPRDAD